MKLATVFIVLFVGLISSSLSAPIPGWDTWYNPFSSSVDNARIANRGYSDSWIQRQVAKSFGDEIPRMRDDLLRRKSNGEGFFQRHYNAWTTGQNWRVDRHNDQREREYPYQGKK
jgi:hypothetical protein